mgnify:CR=1 FL=1
MFTWWHTRPKVSGYVLFRWLSCARTGGAQVLDLCVVNTTITVEDDAAIVVRGMTLG